MAGITPGDMGTTYNLPNYHGELIGLTPADTPLLSASGGLAGAGVADSTIVEWSTYDLRDPRNTGRLEGAAAPNNEARVRASVTNRTQIFHESIETSYTKQAATGQMGTKGASGLGNPVQNEHVWQVEQALKTIARDVNFAFWYGKKVDPNDNNTARKMDGLATAAGNATNKGAVFTGASAATDTVTVTHALTAGDQVVFTDVGASTAIVANRVYWVQSVGTTATFKVAATKGGSAITIGTATVSGYGIDATDNVVGVDDVEQLMQDVFDNGGISEQGTATLFVPSAQKRRLTAAYATAYGKADPFAGTREVGGVSMNTIVTNFGALNIVIDRALSSDTIAVVSLEQVQPVFLNVPGKGLLFEEALAKTGSAERSQIYGELTLKYGNKNAHGVLRGLAV